MKIKIKVLLLSIIWLLAFNIWLGSDLKIEKITLSDWWSTVSLFSEPKIDIKIINNWDLFDEENIQEWLIKCTEKESWNEIFISAPMDRLSILSWDSMVAGNLRLKSTLTMKERKVDIICTINELYNPSNNSSVFSFYVDRISRFDSTMQRSIEPIKHNLDSGEPNSMQWWWASITNFILKKIMNFLIPIIIIIWITVWIIWWYKLFFSTNYEDTKKGIQLILYWTIWIIIIVSAEYIWTILFEEILESGNAIALNTIDIAENIYLKIIYPFIKIWIYLVLWLLFVVLTAKVFTYITKSDWSSQKKLINIISRSTISMIIIIWAKSLVEAVYWAKDKVLEKSAQNLWDIWTWILANKNIPIIYTTINRIMWLTSLAILIIILYQGFQILINPDKAENRQKIWKSIIYIFIGILIIWAGYIISNFLVID